MFAHVCVSTIAMQLAYTPLSVIITYIGSRLFCSFPVLITLLQAFKRVYLVERTAQDATEEEEIQCPLPAGV